MHGVGYPFIQAAFHAFGLPPPIPVPLQVQPDPTFPTVKLPNPEEGAGALQLSFQTAAQHKARLVVASDPDADRFVFAELQEEGEGGWRVFNGNEIGLMCAQPPPARTAFGSGGCDVPRVPPPCHICHVPQLCALDAGQSACGRGDATLCGGCDGGEQRCGW